MDTHTQILQVKGITCDACITLVTKRLSRIPGVVRVVSVKKSGIAEIFADSILPADVFAQTFSDTDYTVTPLPADRTL